jgi:lipooligosaccharide transport system ATP-binding protein
MDEAERLADRLAVLDHGRKIAEGSPRELIAAHIEAHVIEVFGDGALEWGKAVAALAQRTEVSGETVFCYAADPTALLNDLEGRTLRYLHRPANLEDLFLKLTGREMRDEA